MQAEGLFPRLLELIGTKKAPEDKECRNRLLDVLYEMSRVQRLRWEDLGTWSMPLIWGVGTGCVCDADRDVLYGQRLLVMHLYHICLS